MDSSQVVCAILLVYVMILLWPKISNLLGINNTKSRAVSSGSMVYADKEEGGIFGTAFLNDSKAFTYWTGDSGIQNWIYLTPRLAYTKEITGSNPTDTYFFPTDGLYYVTYNSCFGLIHTSSDFGQPNTKRMTIIASQNRGYSGTNGLKFYSDGGGPHLFVSRTNNQNGVLLVFKLFDAFSGSSPTNRY